MTYESWRCTYQDSEQAARAAYKEAQALAAKCLRYRAALEMIDGRKVCLDNCLSDKDIARITLEKEDEPTK